MELEKFIEYCKTHNKGDEKGEAQIFLDRFFSALGYEDGLKGAGAECEFRIKDTQKKTTSFGDLVWKGRVLIEMKKAKEDLSIHIQQATSYWLKLTGDRPQYIILCNFNEFWIYDFNKNIYEPVEKINIEDLDKRKEALSFLFPRPKVPVFGHNFDDITSKAVEKIAFLFKTLVKRKIDRDDALRYCLQCIVAMFAEDIDLLPNKIFSRLVKDCIDNKQSSYDLIGGLFREMNTKGVTPSGRYKDVDYFNGGLFEQIIPIELTDYEIGLLNFSAIHDWKKINPAIFGTIFEKSLEDDERHKLGAHYTSELDIKKIVDPVIVQPWLEKIDLSDTSEELYSLLHQLVNYRVLDPACGSGNFLFVAFKELKLIERSIIAKIKSIHKTTEEKLDTVKFLNHYQFVHTGQFYGIDIKPFAVELAKVTLMLAKEVSWFEMRDYYDSKNHPLPLDNLDSNIICADALLNESNGQRVWPYADVIIGNPPYQGQRNMQREFGADYVNKLREAYSEVPGKADFCVYWFYKAHNAIPPNGYAGLVGTNTITQNYSRTGSLEYIINNGGTLYNAYQSFQWTGEAVVHVSIANWVKGDYHGEKYLFTQENEKADLVSHRVESINSSLSLDIDLTEAHILPCNIDPKVCFQGQVPGEEGFMLTVKDALILINKNPEFAEVLKPHLIGNDLLNSFESKPARYCIDFTGKDLVAVSQYKELFKIIETKVLPVRKRAYDIQVEENKTILARNPKAKTNKHHIGFYNRWWQLTYAREDLLSELNQLPRYIACSGVSKRNIFEFISSDIIPNAGVFAFCFEDDYSFGIIQSIVHFEWWRANCSTLETRLRYTSKTVWDTFPWPQDISRTQVEKIAKLAQELRVERHKQMQPNKLSLRDLYRIVEKPGKNSVKSLQEKLDEAVMDAYGIMASSQILPMLLELNNQVFENINLGFSIQKPGLPDFITDKKKFVSKDCVRMNS